jgi:hypothetical protein
MKYCPHQNIGAGFRIGQYFFDVVLFWMDAIQPTEVA